MNDHTNRSIEAERAAVEAWANENQTRGPSLDDVWCIYLHGKDAGRHVPTAGAGATSEPTWGPVHTVTDLVRNLMTLDQGAPIFTAFHVTIDGERRCRTRGITISRERVIDGKWIDSSRKDVPYAHVIWAKPDERAQQPAGAAAELPPLPSAFMDLYSPTVRKAWADQMQQYARNAIAADRHQRKEAARQEMPRDYFAWWTSIETDVRKSMLVFAHREPERLHALVRQAYEAGQQSLMAVAVAQEGEQLTNNKGESA